MPNELGDFIEASGLLSYDPEAITRIYAGHPQRLIKRLWQTLVPIGLYLLGVSTDWLFGLLNNRERSRQRAKEAAELLVDLGPAFIKAGQALSTRPEIVPPVPAPATKTSNFPPVSSQISGPVEISCASMLCGL